MDKANLLSYLQTIIDLEASLYTQKETWKKLNNDRSQLGKKGVIYCKEVRDANFSDYFTSGKLVFAIFVGIMAFAFKFMTELQNSDMEIWNFISTGLSCVGSSLITAVVAFLIGLGLALILACIQYSSALSKVSKETMDAQVDYTANMTADNERVNRELAVAQMIKNEQNRLDVKIKETKALLDEYYNLGILYPTYRNFVAVCSIYQYIDAGICGGLTGNDGAYNKYDLDSKLNKIISQLDVIIEKLDEIKEIQYTIYQALQESNRISRELVREVRNQTKYIKSAADSAAVTASNSAISVYTQQQTLNEVQKANDLERYRFYTST